MELLLEGNEDLLEQFYSQVTLLQPPNPNRSRMFTDNTRQFVLKVKLRYEHQPEKYKLFISILRNFSTSTIKDTCAQVEMLFYDAPQLLAEFMDMIKVEFLTPENSLTTSQSKALIAAPSTLITPTLRKGSKAATPPPPNSSVAEQVANGTIRLASSPSTPSPPKLATLFEAPSSPRPGPASVNSARAQSPVVLAPRTLRFRYQPPPPSPSLPKLAPVFLAPSSPPPLPPSSPSSDDDLLSVKGNKDAKLEEKKKKKRWSFLMPSSLIWCSKSSQDEVICVEPIQKHGSSLFEDQVWKSAKVEENGGGSSSGSKRVSRGSSGSMDSSIGSGVSSRFSSEIEVEVSKKSKKKNKYKTTKNKNTDNNSNSGSGTSNMNLISGSDGEREREGARKRKTKSFKTMLRLASTVKPKSRPPTEVIEIAQPT